MPGCESPMRLACVRWRARPPAGRAPNDREPGARPAGAARPADAGARHPIGARHRAQAEARDRRARFLRGAGAAVAGRPAIFQTSPRSAAIAEIVAKLRGTGANVCLLTVPDPIQYRVLLGPSIPRRRTCGSNRPSSSGLWARRRRSDLGAGADGEGLPGRERRDRALPPDGVLKHAVAAH